MIGKIRYTVVEVIHYGYVVVSAYGEKWGWFRNIAIQPVLEFMQVENSLYLLNVS